MFDAVIRKQAVSRAALVVLAGTGMIAAVAVPSRAAAVVPMALALGWIAWLQHAIRTASVRLGKLTTIADDGATHRLDVGLSQVERQLEALRHRNLALHPVSGLPVREALVDRIAGDGEGLLGVVVFADLDRLSAFDPLLADRVFAVCCTRLQAMMPAARFLAQIDRGHVGVWFGDRQNDADAWAELDAVSYALSELVVDGDTQVIPQIAFRLASYDPAERLAPSAFVARAQASFSLPVDVASAEERAASRAATARDLFALEQDLRQAIDRRELRLDYQPLIDASQKRVCGAEALIRWDHPTRGQISPGQFVPVLEAMGLAREIGAWAMNTAVREAQVWSAAGLGHLRVAVNVSSLQLEGNDLPRAIARMLHGHGVAASQLEVELTESVATSDADHCRQVFQTLRAMGVKLAVDDFGTGYSGFSSLRALAFDKIKIDREFVTDVDRRGDRQAICQSIIALGRGLGIRVLAEGVERHGEYEWLRRHGCHHFQGYYFGRPMAGAAFVAFVRDGAALDRLLAHGADPSRILERLSA